MGNIDLAAIRGPHMVPDPACPDCGGEGYTASQYTLPSGRQWTQGEPCHRCATRVVAMVPYFPPLSPDAVLTGLPPLRPEYDPEQRRQARQRAEEALINLPHAIAVAVEPAVKAFQGMAAALAAFAPPSIARIAEFRTNLDAALLRIEHDRRASVYNERKARRLARPRQRQLKADRRHGR